MFIDHQQFKKWGILPPVIAPQTPSYDPFDVIQIMKKNGWELVPKTDPRSSIVTMIRGEWPRHDTALYDTEENTVRLVVNRGPGQVDIKAIKVEVGMDDSDLI